MHPRHTWLLLLPTAVGMASPPLAFGQRAILVLRHAERLEYESADGPLSEAGLARAQRLALLLKDAGVTAIYTSEYKRTIQTATPLAAALGVPLTSIGGKTAEEEVKATLARVRSRDQNGVAMIVGHGTTVILYLKEFGLQPPVVIQDREHDDLFVVVPARDGPPAVLRLNY